jgi:hypothetical protein
MKRGTFMKQRARYEWLLVGLAAACTTTAKDSDPSNQASEPESAGAAEVTSPAPSAASPPANGSAGVWNGNIVSSGGRTLVDIGSMKGLRSTDSIKHIYERGVSGVPNERVYLRTVLVDYTAGLDMEFEVNYLDEDGPIELSNQGYLLLKDAGVERLATTGTVTVSRKETGPWTLSFNGLEMGVRGADGTVSSPQPLGSGSIVGDVERICTVGFAHDSHNPFCGDQP